MGEAIGSAGTQGAPVRQPADGEHTAQRKGEAHERPDQETAGDPFGRWAERLLLLAVGLLEVAWLIALAYVIQRFVLTPLVG